MSSPTCQNHLVSPESSYFTSVSPTHESFERSFAYLSRERLLLGDIFGKMFLVDIEFGASGVEGMKATDLGDVSPFDNC